MEAIKNKRAYFDYEFLEKFEAGMVLYGYEVKAIKSGKMSLAGSYVVLRSGEVYLINANIAPYQPQNTPKDYAPTRARKLLLKKKEIQYLFGKSQERGLTLIPLRVYSNKGKLKIEFAVSKGRKKADKKELIKKRETDKEMSRELRARG
ncbi:MAG: SsrA-binding protein SmpB [Candidatus Nealsonbacteria bacterium]